MSKYNAIALIFTLIVLQGVNSDVKDDKRQTTAQTKQTAENTLSSLILNGGGDEQYANTELKHNERVRRQIYDRYPYPVPVPIPIIIGGGGFGFGRGFGPRGFGGRGFGGRGFGGRGFGGFGGRGIGGFGGRGRG